MNAEQFTALGSIASALILAVATIAAVVQLRHLRTATQLEGFLRLFDRFNSAEMLEARNYCLAQDFDDPGVVSRMLDEGLDRRILMAGNYFQELGGLLRTGVLQPNLFASIFYNAPALWRKLEPIAYELSKRRGGAPIWLDFEYAAWLAQQRPMLNEVKRAFPNRFLRTVHRPGIEGSQWPPPS